MSESKAVADNLLVAVEELRAAGRRIDRVALVLERVAPDLSSLRLTFEGVAIHEIRHALTQINERLAVISKDVDDVERATREATGRVPVVTGEHKSGKWSSVVKHVGRLDWRLVLALGFSAGLAGGVGIAVYQVIRAALAH